MTLYTSQSQIIEAQRCPRRRYWSHFALPTPCVCDHAPDCPRCHGTGRVAGIEPVRQSVPLLLGGAVHHGLDLLLKYGDAERAVEATLTEYRRELSLRSLDLAPSEEQQYVAEEQMALGEALVRVASLRIVPYFSQRYEVVWTERDLAYPLTAGVMLRGRVDALLRERATGDLYPLNWKTKGGNRLDDRAIEDAQHDDQGLSETWLVERWLNQGWPDNTPENVRKLTSATNAQLAALPTETAGVLMCWLLKGERRESAKGSGQWQQSSPLIRGYRKFDDTGHEQWAWSWYWTDSSSGANRALGRGWQKVDMWREPGGIKAWLDRLNTGTVQPEAGDCLANQFVMPAPYYRQPSDIADWVKQAADQESRCLEPMPSDYEADPAAAWPQHRHSCSYPGRCDFYNICWGAPHVRLSPLDNGYQRREPYVPAAETVEVENG